MCTFCNLNWRFANYDKNSYLDSLVINFRGPDVVQEPSEGGRTAADNVAQVSLQRRGDRLPPHGGVHALHGSHRGDGKLVANLESKDLRLHRNLQSRGQLLTGVRRQGDKQATPPRTRRPRLTQARTSSTRSRFTTRQRRILFLVFSIVRAVTRQWRCLIDVFATF